MSTDVERKVAEVFDDWANRGRAEGMERGHALAATHGFKKLSVGSGDRYLDIGCGNGYSVRWAADVSPDVAAVGIDVSEKMIERARAQSAEQSQCRFMAGSFPNPELKDGSFDCVFSMEVFYYIADINGALAAARQLLAPGGRFVCIVDHYLENEASHSWAPDIGLALHLESEASWQAMFERAGFTGIEQERVRAASVEGKPDGWEQLEGSLLTYGLAG